MVASLHDETELVALKQPLEGRARDKLARHLHDTISLAVEWIRLTDLCRGRGEHRGEGRAADLCCQLEVRLRETRSALKPARGRGSVDALDGVLEDLEARIQGRQIKERTAIFGDLLLLPKLPLEDDFEPADNHLDVLRHAILEAEKSESDPREILNECLNRQEYRRARAILDIHDLGAQAHEDYEREVADKLSSLTASLNALEIEIEDAFLLGQLHEDAEEGGSADDLNHKVLERSQLLSIVREASGKLYRTSELEVDELREISRSVEDVSGKVKELASSRREQLSREFVHIMDQLPDTEGGQADHSGASWPAFDWATAAVPDRRWHVPPAFVGPWAAGDLLGYTAERGLVRATGGMASETGSRYLRGAIWREQLTGLFPVVVELGFDAAAAITSAMGTSWQQAIPAGRKVSDSELRLDPKEVMEIFSTGRFGKVPQSIWSFLDLLRRTRNELAHMSPLELQRMRHIWQGYDLVCKRFGNEK